MQEQNGHIHSCKFENKKQGCWKYDFMSLQHGQGASRTDFSKYVKRYNCKLSNKGYRIRLPYFVDLLE